MLSIEVNRTGPLSSFQLCQTQLYLSCVVRALCKATMASPACGGSQQGWRRTTAAGRDAKCSPVCPLGLSVGLKDGPVLCQWPQSSMDVQPGRMVSATLGEIHFPRCYGRKMGPASHPSARQQSGKQESLAESSPASPAQQSVNRARRCGSSTGLIPQLPRMDRTPKGGHSVRPSAELPAPSKTKG